MPQRRKSAAEILLNDNSRRLSRDELLKRVQEERSQVELNPTVERGKPKMPGDFSELEAAHWKAASKVMKSRGTLSRGDGEALELWARTKARYSIASKALAEEGLIVVETRVTKKGDTYEVRVPNPHLKIVEQCERMLQAMASKLGLNPLERSKVKATRGATATPKATTWTPTPGTLGALCPELFDAKGRPKPC
jgi:phage terminase small subunit